MGCCESSELEEERVSLLNPASINNDDRWSRDQRTQTPIRTNTGAKDAPFGRSIGTPVKVGLSESYRTGDGQQRALNRIVQRTLKQFIDITQVGEGVGSVLGDGYDKTEQHSIAMARSGGPASQLSMDLPITSETDDSSSEIQPQLALLSKAQNDFIKLCSDSLIKTLQRMEVQDYGSITISFSEASFSVPHMSSSAHS